MGVERVDVDALSSLIYAGWLPQDGTFDSELAAGLEVERNLLWHNMVAHRTGAGHSQTLADTWRFIRTLCGSQVVMTASDQHQPASSRAIAALAITGRFLR